MSDDEATPPEDQETAALDAPSGIQPPATEPSGTSEPPAPEPDPTDVFDLPARRSPLPFSAQPAGDRASVPGAVRTEASGPSALDLPALHAAPASDPVEVPAGTSRRAGTGALGTQTPPPVFDQDIAPTPASGAPVASGAAPAVAATATRPPAQAPNPARPAPRRDVAYMGELPARALDRRAAVNDRHIAKLEPGWDTWRRVRSLIVLVVIVVVVAAAVAAVFSIAVEILGAAANHAISKSAGS